MLLRRLSSIDHSIIPTKVVIFVVMVLYIYIVQVFFVLKRCAKLLFRKLCILCMSYQNLYNIVTNDRVILHERAIHTKSRRSYAKLLIPFTS